jgi:hypothetical protein
MNGHQIVSGEISICVVDFLRLYQKEFTFMHPHIGHSRLTHGDLLSGDQAHIYNWNIVPHTLLDIFVEWICYDKKQLPFRYSGNIM